MRRTDRWFQVLAASQPSRSALPCCGSPNLFRCFRRSFCTGYGTVLLPPRASPSGFQQPYTREYTRRLSGKSIGRNKPKTVDPGGIDKQPAAMGRNQSLPCTAVWVSHTNVRLNERTTVPNSSYSESICIKLRSN